MPKSRLHMQNNQLKQRYSVHHFDPQKSVDVAKIETLIQAFHYCPSSLNMQPWRLVVITDPAIKQQLAPYGLYSNGKAIQNCSHLFIFVRKNLNKQHVDQVINTTKRFASFTQKKSIIRGLHLITRYIKPKSWLDNQLYLNFGFMLATCASLDIDSLPMEGIKSKAFHRILQLPRQEKVVLALAVGVATDEDKAQNISRIDKSRLPIDQVVQRR
jgi:nitroreductase/dihydropteridine reductase